jgi:hypothetical protein
MTEGAEAYPIKSSGLFQNPTRMTAVFLYPDAEKLQFLGRGGNFICQEKRASSLLVEFFA